MSKHRSKNKSSNDEVLRTCPNGRCSMHRVVIETTKTNCSLCHAHLKDYDYLHDGDDSPALTQSQAEDLTDELRANDAAKEPLLLGIGGATESAETEDDEPATFRAPCDVKGCPIAPKCTVYIPFTLYSTWLFLAKRFDVEWIAYLRGELKDESTIHIAADGMYFPKQVAQSAHVAAEPNTVLPGTIGSVHSHVDMEAFMSAEDERHFNHPVDMVINRKGNIVAVMRRKLRCGEFERVKCSVLLNGTEADVGAEDALEAVLTKETSAFTPPSTTVSTHRGNGGMNIVPRPNATYDPKSGYTYWYTQDKHGLTLVRENRKHRQHSTDGGRNWEDLRI